MTSFESFQFAQPIADNLRRHGFETPTPIQAEAIPAVLEGRDVVGIAQTGTGKTAAFVLPILHKLSSGPGRHVRALIVGPTRELAEQITGVVHELGRGTHLHTAMIFGGVSYRPQFDSIRRGAEIVVACPGRLLDHIRQGTIRLDRVEVLVLDEADQMFDMGFLPDIKEIIKRVSPQRQTLLFSATMPHEIRKLAHEILRNPKEIKIGHASPVETVSHAIFPVTQNLKPNLLIELLRRTDAGPVLIFTRTRHRAKKLGDQLSKSGFRASSIQGDLSQNKRKEAMDGFRNGRFQILVATDVAARGIDVSNISHVINFDMPATVDAYTHRIGRTGRAAKTGDAYTLVTREDADMVRQIERVLRSQIERRYLDGFDYKATPARFEHAERGQESRGGQERPREQFRERAPRAHFDDRARPRHRDEAPSQPRPHFEKPHHAPRREEPAREPASAPVRAEHPREPARPPHRESFPRREFRQDDRGPRREFRQEDRGPRRHDEAPRPAQSQAAPFPAKSAGPHAEKKPFEPKFGKKPFDSKFEKKPFDPRRKPKTHRKGQRQDEPTMTGEPRFQREVKPKRPFWERFSR